MAYVLGDLLSCKNTVLLSDSGGQSGSQPVQCFAHYEGCVVIKEFNMNLSPTLNRTNSDQCSCFKGRFSKTSETLVYFSTKMKVCLTEKKQCLNPVVNLEVRCHSFD